MKYTPTYFHRNMPEWKRKKDPILSRLFYRPVSFLNASFCAFFKINANSVSYFSMFVAIAACCLFLTGNFVCGLIGAILINYWLILDCTDGNLARSFRKQPYGEFADGISSYILVALLCVCVSFYTYFNGGIFIDSGFVWIILIGAFASISDTLMRLIYQKFKSVTNDMIKIGVVANYDDERLDHSKVSSFKVRIESEFGIGGILPLFLLFSIIFNFTDVFLIYCVAYYGLSFLYTLVTFVLKARKYRNVEIGAN